MVMIAHASHDERGKYTGGNPGDQTGQEVCIRSWYNRPWNVIIRAKSASVRKKIAHAMIAAANNNHIGYSQGRRNDALAVARTVGYDISLINKDCDVDCSSLVTLACIYAGIPISALYKNGNSATTRTLQSRLLATGSFLSLTSASYTTKSDLLLVGDILLYEGHHVAVVVKSDIVDTNTKSVTEIAREVLDGKWGNGNVRRLRLMAADYDYNAVQAEVNRLIKERDQ